jgi:hypothetical protein
MMAAQEGDLDGRRGCIVLPLQGDDDAVDIIYAEELPFLQNSGERLRILEGGK